MCQLIKPPYPVQLLKDNPLLSGALGGGDAERHRVVLQLHDLLLAAAVALVVLPQRPLHLEGLSASPLAAGPAGEAGGGAPGPAAARSTGVTISLPSHPRSDNPLQLTSVRLEVPFIVPLTDLLVTFLVTLRITLHQDLIILEVTLNRIIFTNMTYY